MLESYSSRLITKEHSQFVPMAVEAAIGWLFEHGNAKEFAIYFQAA